MSDSFAPPVAIDLSARATPLTAPQPLGIDLFEPLVLDDKGKVVMGGPGGLTLFNVVQGNALAPYARIPAQHWIWGMAYSGGDLYVLDGSVLSAWDLAGGRPATPTSPPPCAAATNLATGANCTGAATAAVLELPAAAAEMQASVINARRQEAWGRMLAAGEALQAAGGAPGGLSDMLRDIRTLLGSSAPGSADPALSPEALRQRRLAADAAGAAMVFSAPLVRQSQTDGYPQDMVFVQGGDGRLHRLGDMLGTRVVTRFDSAALPLLAGDEQDDLAVPGETGLRLYYVAADGSLKLVDADPNPPVVTGAWGTRGTPEPDRVLPLRSDGGKLWGGGVMGSALFGTDPNPPAWQPFLDLPAPGGRWTDYAVDSERQLVLASDGLNSRLHSWAPGAVQPDRWGQQVAPRPAWTLLVPPPVPESGLALQLDREQGDGGGLGYRLYPLNPVDDPYGMWSFSPPPELAQGALGGNPGLAVVLAKPVLFKGTLYLAGATATLAQEVARLATPAADGTPWRGAVAALVGGDGRPLADAPALAAAAPPPWPAAAAAYPLALLSDPGVKQRADAYLAQMRSDVIPVGIDVRWVVYQRFWDMHQDDNYSIFHRVCTGEGAYLAQGEAPLAGAAVVVQASGGPSTTVNTDGQGRVMLPHPWTGLQITLAYPAFTGQVNSPSVSLRAFPDGSNTLLLECYNPHYENEEEHAWWLAHPNGDQHEDGYEAPTEPDPEQQRHQQEEDGGGGSGGYFDPDHPNRQGSSNSGYDPDNPDG